MERAQVRKQGGRLTCGALAAGCSLHRALRQLAAAVADFRLLLSKGPWNSSRAGRQRIACPARAGLTTSSNMLQQDCASAGKPTSRSRRRRLVSLQGAVLGGQGRQAGLVCCGELQAAL